MDEHTLDEKEILLRRGRSRHLWILTLTAVIMHTTMALVWWSVGAAFVAHLATGDPSIARSLEEVSKKYDARDEDEARKYLQTLAPVFERIDWFVVSVLSSLMAFSVLGFFCCRLSGSMDYLGILPVLSILSGQNPAILSVALAERGMSAASLGFGQQVALLALQVTTVYLFGSMGTFLHRRRRGKR